MTQLFLVSFMGELLLAAVCVGALIVMSPKEPEQSSECHHLGRT